MYVFSDVKNKLHLEETKLFCCLVRLENTTLLSLALAIATVCDDRNGLANAKVWCHLVEYLQGKN